MTESECPVFHVASEVCVCAHVPVYAGSFSDHLGRWHPVAHIFWYFWRMTVGKGCSSSADEYLTFILMEKTK